MVICFDSLHLYFELLFLHLVPANSLSLSVSSSHPYPHLCLDGPGAQEPMQLTDVQAAMEFIAAAEVAVIGFFQVCSDIATCPSPSSVQFSHSVVSDPL